MEICERLHYDLVALYIRIQVTASWEKLGKSVMARNLLQKSLEQAIPDKFLVPFAENYPYLKELLEGLSQKDKTGFVSQVICLGKIFENRCNKLKNANIYPEIFSLLTEREQKLVQPIVSVQLFLHKKATDRDFFVISHPGKRVISNASSTGSV